MGLGVVGLEFQGPSVIRNRLVDPSRFAKALPRLLKHRRRRGRFPGPAGNGRSPRRFVPAGQSHAQVVMGFSVVGLDVQGLFGISRSRRRSVRSAPKQRPGRSGLRRSWLDFQGLLKSPRPRRTVRGRQEPHQDRCKFRHNRSGRGRKGRMDFQTSIMPDRLVHPALVGQAQARWTSQCCSATCRPGRASKGSRCRSKMRSAAKPTP